MQTRSLEWNDGFHRRPIVQVDSHDGTLTGRSAAESNVDLSTLPGCNGHRPHAIPHHSTVIPLSVEKINVVFFDGAAIEFYPVDLYLFIGRVLQNNTRTAEVGMLLVESL